MRPGEVVAACMLAVGFSPLAEAGDTYCVGGKGACSSSVVRAQHGDWHFHCHVTDGQKCFECFDEEDATCQTIFLATNPGWRSVSITECIVRGVVAPLAEGVRFHKINGVEVAEPPPPPPRSVTLKPGIVGVSPGPYAPGDEVVIDVRVTDDAGQPRDFGAGEVVLIDAQGREVARVPVGEIQGAHGRARAKLPGGGTFTVRFEPRDVQLLATEQMGATQPADVPIDVGACNFRADVSGSPGEVHLAGAPIALAGTLRTHKGAAADPAQIPGVALKFSIQLDAGGVTEAMATPDGSRMVAQVDLPAIQDAQVAGRIVLSGAGDGVTVCPGEPLAMTVTQLGVSITAKLPSACYATLPCKASFTFRTPGSGAAEQQARAFLSRSDLSFIATANGNSIKPTGSPASGRVDLSFTPEQSGQASFRVELSGAGQELAHSAQTEIRDAVKLSLPEVLDLGTIGGGTSWIDTCGNLDFSRSAGVLGAAFSFQIDAKDEACKARHVTHAEGLRYAFSEPFERKIDAKLAVPVCVEVPRCPDEAEAEGVTLLVESLVPEFPNQRGRVRLKYRIEGRDLLSCWRDLLGAIAASAIAGFIAYGFIWPRAFEDGDQIKIARDRRKLARTKGVLLSELRRGKRRWHRSARVAFNGSGDATATRSAALFTLRPIPEGIAMESGATVHKENRRTKKMEPEAPHDGHYELSKNVVYQVGDVMFVIT